MAPTRTLQQPAPAPRFSRRLTVEPGSTGRRRPARAKPLEPRLGLVQQRAFLARQRCPHSLKLLSPQLSSLLCVAERGPSEQLDLVLRSRGENACVRAVGEGEYAGSSLAPWDPACAVGRRAEAGPTAAARSCADCRIHCPRIWLRRKQRHRWTRCPAHWALAHRPPPCPIPQPRTFPRRAPATHQLPPARLHRHCRCQLRSPPRHCLG